MDPERQPLLAPREVRSRRYRPLTSEEVLTSRQQTTWRRARFFVVIMFWAIMAMFLSSVATILIRAPRCPLMATPSVPPVHLNFAPLLVTAQAMDPRVETDHDHGNINEIWML